MNSRFPPKGAGADERRVTTLRHAAVTTSGEYVEMVRAHTYRKQRLATGAAQPTQET